ncbi:MAG: tetratricopeptide repeat protein, partial [Polaromonas sp.]|nr:tetratricopeptide repeat protein [Gemmatimonadaceae bacterium]
MALRTAFTASDSGDHARSGELLRAMIARDKSERRNLLRALADQIYATNKPAEAVPLYREILTWTDLPADERRGTRVILAQALVSAGAFGEAIVEARGVAEAWPNDIPARIAYARIASWSNKLRLAQAEYDAVLRLDSTNADARRGKAQVLSWLGRHRKAQRVFREALVKAPADAETQYLLAESLAWMGRPDLALGMLDTLAAKRPDFIPAVALRSRLMTLATPSATLEGGFATQSDGIRMAALTLMQNMQVQRGRGMGAFTLRQERDMAPDGRSVQSTRPQVSAQYRVTDDVQLR